MALGPNCRAVMTSHLPRPSRSPSRPRVLEYGRPQRVPDLWRIWPAPRSSENFLARDACKKPAGHDSAGFSHKWYRKWLWRLQGQRRLSRLGKTLRASGRSAPCPSLDGVQRRSHGDHDRSAPKDPNHEVTDKLGAHGFRLAQERVTIDLGVGEHFERVSASGSSDP